MAKTASRCNGKISPHFLAYLLIFRNTDQQGPDFKKKLQHNEFESFLKGAYLFLPLCILFVCLSGRLHTQMCGDLMAKTDSRCNRKFPLISWTISCRSFKTPINKAGFALKKTSKCVEVLFIFVCLYIPDQKARIFFYKLHFFVPQFVC